MVRTFLKMVETNLGGDQRQHEMLQKIYESTNIVCGIVCFLGGVKIGEWIGMLINLFMGGK
jgi:hypothetical protein